MAMNTIIGIALVAAWAVLTPLDMSFAQDTRKNIVFLLTDDQACITLGCYGNRQVKTPNIDALAADGITFDRHYVTTAICMASRANIMTGLYEYRTGCNFTYGKLPEKLWRTSYPMRLRAAGYRTAFAGKFGFEIEGQKELPSDDFDEWGGGPGQTHYETARNQAMLRYASEYPHSTRAYGAFGRQFIRQSVADKRPFCLSISFKAAHRPVTPDPTFDAIYADTRFEKPANYGREHGRHLAEQSTKGRQFPRFEEWGYATRYSEVMRKYHQQIYAVDVAVGMIREELKAQGVEKNTVILFTSDNGFMCGAHGYGSKVIPYEESTRVPLIILDPDCVISGKRCNSLTGSIDLAPTILDFANLPAADDIDGVSLMPLLTNPAADVRESLALMNFWGPTATHSFGVVTKRWKYLYWYSQQDGMLATEELFDMSKDRNELKNAVHEDRFLSELNRIRALYEKHVYQIKEAAINQDYRQFNVLFDRKQPWQTKRELLAKPKR